VASAAPAPASTVATTPHSSDPIPLCAAGDHLTAIPVWLPEVDDAGNVSSEPPQKDGQVVYIQLYRHAAEVSCNDKDLNAFNWPADKNDVNAGGLAINIRGNAQFANGMCYFSGYYMNEQVMGIHQGWVETYFGSLPKKDVILSGRYCLSAPIE
jgi:hypothetical protein